MPRSKPLDEFFDAGDPRLAAHAFYSLAEALPQFVWSSDPNRKCDYVNHRWLEFSGLSPNNVLGRDWSEYVFPKELDFVLSRWKAANEQGALFEVRCQLRSRTGEYHWYCLRASPVVDNNQIVRWIMISTEVEHGDREGLRLADLKRFLGTNMLGVVIARDDGRILEANEGFLRLLGYPGGDEGPTGMNIMEMTPPEYLIRDREALRDLRIKGSCPPYQKELKARTGGTVPVLIGLSLLEDSPGSHMIFVLDLERQREMLTKLHCDKAALEKEVEARTAQLRETIAQLEAFAYSLAHDMRAPCRALTNYSQILLRDYAENLPDEPRGFLRRISIAAHRLDAFIRDLLIYSRVAHDKMPLTQVDVEATLKEVIASSPEFQPPDVLIEIRGPLGIVYANEMLLAQCLTNLLTNACKFVRKGEIPRITVSVERHDGLARIIVADNGIGISEYDQKRIFNVFERIHHESEYSGTGVGLSIVGKAMERMKGQVGVDSKLNEGSRFWLELREPPASPGEKQA